MYVSNLLVPNPTCKIHHNLSRKRIDISCWPWWGITIPSGGFFAQRLAAQVLGFQGFPWPVAPKWAPDPVVFSWSYGMLWGPNVLTKCVTVGYNDYISGVITPFYDYSRGPLWNAPIIPIIRGWSFLKFSNRTIQMIRKRGISIVSLSPVWEPESERIFWI